MRVLWKILVVLLGAGLLLLGCETNPERPNIPPETTIANIPPDSSTVFALVTLHWDGGDDDGYIAEYEYRYTTYFLNPADSTVTGVDSTEWDNTKLTSLTLPFNSADSVNYQVFEVRSVDDRGDVDPTPAEKHFFTRSTVPPQATIEIPENNQQFFVIDEVTDWWQGVPLTYTGEDVDGEIEEFGWIVDQGDTTWTQDTTLYIPPDKFSGQLAGMHTIEVIAVDNTNIISSVAAEVSVELVRPTFLNTQNEILIIDETNDSQLPQDVKGNKSNAEVDSVVDAFYRNMFGQSVDEWDYDANGGAPSRDILGQYNLVIWHGDDRPTTGQHDLPNHTALFRDYMNVGGDFVMSGWRILRAFSDDFPAVFEEGSFVRDYLHIVNASETASFDPTTGQADFTGAIGVGDQFSDVRVDSNKVITSFPFYGKLGQINLMLRQGEDAGFAKYIYSYDGNTPEYRRQPCGLRYYGTSFNAIVLGFPMFFIMEDDAIVMGEEILSSLGYTKN